MINILGTVEVRRLDHDGNIGDVTHILTYSVKQETAREQKERINNNLEEDEKFYWAIASESFQNSGLGFLNVLRNDDWRLCSKSESRDCKTQFTVGEYEALQDKLGFPKDLFKKEVITND